MRSPFGLTIGLICLALACKTPPRNCVPPEVAVHRPLYDAGGSREYHAFDIGLQKSLQAKMLAGVKKDAAKSKKLSLIAFSGGGKFGAYSAGVVCGMSSAGCRPCFDIVTGVSTGSLVATLTFLGPEYDARMEQLYTTMKTEDIVTEKGLFAILTSDSAYDSSPLAKLIAREVTEDVICKVANEHKKGRKLFVGTTYIDARRITIWDMGAIACSDRPDRLTLFRKVLLASCSVPGGLPPVEFDVTYNGVPYKELHVDGGASSQLFIRANMLPEMNKEYVAAGYRPFEGSEAYLVVAGKIYSDPECTKDKLLKIIGAASSSIIYSATRNDLGRIANLCFYAGIKYNQIGLSAEVPVNPDALYFEPKELRLLFNEGFKDGSTPSRWDHLPPDTAIKDQIVPRVGTDFVFDSVPAVPVNGGTTIEIPPAMINATPIVDEKIGSPKTEVK
jgi:hypothetical protein